MSDESESGNIGTVDAIGFLLRKVKYAGNGRGIQKTVRGLFERKVDLTERRCVESIPGMTHVNYQAV